jgi:hypothetical protein
MKWKKNLENFSPLVAENRFDVVHGRRDSSEFCHDQ